MNDRLQALINVPFSFFTFSSSVTQTVGALANFTTTLLSGGPVFQTFLGQMSQMSNAITNFTLSAIKSGSEIEIGRIAAGGAIDNTFGKKLGFTKAIEIFDEVKAKLARDAAALPGSTADYVNIFRLLSDDMGSALNDAKLSGEQLAELFKKKVPEAVRNLTLQSQLYGQDVPVSSLTRTYSKLLSTGVAPAREIFIQRNPVLKSSIADWEKTNKKKLTSLSLTERFNTLNEIFAKTLDPSQMSALTDTLESRFQELKSNVFDPDVGLFGFNRRFKLSNAETTFYEELANTIKPVLRGLSEFFNELVKSLDPLRMLGEIIREKAQPAMAELEAKMNNFTTNFALNDSLPFWARLDKTILDTFNFSPSQLNLPKMIDDFFEGVANFILNFGKNYGPPTQMEAVLNSIINGVWKVIMAILTRVTEVILANPEAAFKFLLVFNPGALFAAGGLLLAAVNTIIAGFQLLIALFSAIPAVFSAITAVIAFLATPIGLAIVAIVAVVGALVYFREEFQRVGNWFGQLAKSIGGYTQWGLEVLQNSFYLLAEAGQHFVDAWNAFIKGDLQKAWNNLVDGFWKATVAGAAAIGGAIGVILGYLADGLRALIRSLINWFWAQLQKVELFFTNMFNAASNAVNGFIENLQNIGKALDPTRLGQNISNVIGRTLRLPGFAQGNPLGLALVREAQQMPSGARLAIANTSEAIIPKEKVSIISNALSSVPGGKGGNNFNFYIQGSDPQEIASAVRKEIISLFGSAV